MLQKMVSTTVNEIVKGKGLSMQGVCNTPEKAIIREGKGKTVMPDRVAMPHKPFKSPLTLPYINLL